VLIEFGGAVVLAGALGALSLRSGISGPGHPVPWEIAIGAVLVSIGMNYLPLLIYAVGLIRSGTARQEVALELETAQQYQRRYGAQQFLLVVPFAVLVIALVQLFMRRNRVGS